ncbi:hypothetical protein ACHAXH_009779 [Discostella pseudostelligera]|jgi:hypothetical protein
MDDKLSPAKAVPPSTSVSESRHTIDDDTFASGETKSSMNTLAFPNSNDINTVDEEMSSSSSGNDCPLFMDGLQSNFAQNTALAALASLLDDDDNDNDGGADRYKETDNRKAASSSSTSKSTTHLNKSGGGKAVKTMERRGNNLSPYSKGKEDSRRKENGEKKEKKKGATLGEAQLFLNMWKL